MKKALIIIIAAGAVTAAYFIIRKKLVKANEPSPVKVIPRQHQRHLTKAFAVAKKHAVK